jgi:hypothetical protein
METSRACRNHARRARPREAYPAAEIDRVMFAPIWSTRVLIGIEPGTAGHPCRSAASELPCRDATSMPLDGPVQNSTTLRLHGLACTPHRVRIMAKLRVARSTI